jgi:transposase
MIKPMQASRNCLTLQGMALIPKHLSQEQMEARRREGSRLLKVGKRSQAEIGCQLGMSGVTVSDWAKRLAACGLRALQRRKAPGQPARPTPAEKQRLLLRLKRGANACCHMRRRHPVSL